MGSKKSRLTLTNISGLPAYLDLRKQRYHCRECDSYFTAKSEIVGDNYFISKRVKRMVLDFATNALTIKHIAETCNVSDHTVQRVIDGASKELKPSILDALPEHIAFVEFKGVKHAEGNMSFIFIDNTNSRIVGVLGDRRKFSLRDYFFAYPLKTRQKVQTVTMDMYMPYMDVVRVVFPNSKIIIDRFHLVQALNRELNKLRIEVMNAFRVPDHRLYNKYKRYWRIFLIPRENLNSWDYQPLKLFDWLTNTGGILDYLLDKIPLLKNCRT
ncbi:ISL3 family transposase [Aerococcus viridans]|uniref:ISL3 family transposase n=1 Tax=Aerococcus viridans TaxID=1377 RepID=UPI003AA987BE